MPSPLGLVVKNGSKTRSTTSAWHAGAGVADPQADVAARAAGGSGTAVLGRRIIDVGGVDGQRAAVGHRVAGVDGEVDQDLLELAGVGEHRPQVARPAR